MTVTLVFILLVPAVLLVLVLSYIVRETELDVEERSIIENIESNMMSTHEWFAQRYVPAALDSSTLQSIPLVKFTRLLNYDAPSSIGMPIRGTCCTVCLTPFNENEYLKVLPPCLHAFHPICIDPWFKTSSTCPICRSHVSSVPCEDAREILLHIQVPRGNL
ncbi:hypothetical protein KP509_25G037000 [Ceratopteris richardii]|uniref:RING-type E3 ubiquitin transferase n=1 Tax=Ceratopteris richardii TaxID=49495 RepID=A0A8T2RS23_CERRI|nr:hypothetical protein KP509_25G037000 [Ceratopteris richardii]